jgi:hypothetical protein
MVCYELNNSAMIRRIHWHLQAVAKRETNKC